MIITDIEVLLAESPAVSPPYNWRAGLPGSSGPTTVGWVLVRTDTGITGVSGTHRGVIVKDIVDRYVRNSLVGMDLDARELIWDRLWELDRIERFPVYLIGAIDCAVWDAGAKAANLPLHRFMGFYREEVPAYASTVTFDTLEQFLDVADQCRELGFPAIKLHAWGDARKDADLSIKLREHVGDDMPLMYDGSAGFDLMDAKYLGDALSDAGFLWYEEPMREYSVTSYKWLSERVSIPLLLGEVAEGSAMNAGDFVMSGGASALRTSAALRGGITGALRIASVAEAFQLRAEVHGGGLVNRALCMSIRSNTYYEALVTSPEVVRPTEVGQDGVVRASQALGIGYEAEWATDGHPHPALAEI